MKQQGTSKIGGHCTAYMEVTTNKIDRKIVVQACLDHAGHEENLGYDCIPDQLGQKIAGQLSKGVSIEAILDEICEHSEDTLSQR